LGTLFINFCLHRLQKLNVIIMFLKLLVSTWIGPKIHGSLKNKVQVFESRWNVFASIWFFFQAPQYWCGEHSNIYIFG